MPSPRVSGVKVSALGPLLVRQGGALIPLSSPMLRWLLGLLAVQPHRMVSRDEIVDTLWGEDPPRTCLASVHVYIGRLRTMLEPGRGPRAGSLINAASGGYIFEPAPGQLDVAEFTSLVAQANDCIRGTDPQTAHDLFTEALELWRGPVLAGVHPRLDSHPAVMALAGKRVRAALDYADTALALGQADRAVSVLRAVSHDESLHEALHARLLLALASSGQQAAALATYAALRTRLNDELGVDPAPELEEAHLRILRGQVPTAAVDATAGRATPAQLPGAIGGFTGRGEVLRQLDACLAASPSGAVSIVAIDGTAGVGKTALAVHWGHRVAHRFRDGQLYVNLRGFDPARTPVSPAEAVRGLLEAFQVPPQRIPATLDAQAALYRSLLAGRQMLVVLDNARDAEQVRPLLPGAPGCFVVVTSRNRLTGLVAAEAAYPMTLDLLPDVEAQELLVHRLGRSRVDAEPHAAQEIIDRCARLPLALSVVAARAATYPAHSLAALVDQLRDIRQSLDVLDSVDPATDVRAVFSWSYHALRPDAARLFRLMGLHPGPDMAVPAVAGLAGAPIDRIRPLLASLTRANLVSEPTPGRYALHDLLRTHAAELAHQHDHKRLRHKAFRRLLDHYLHTASAAAALLYPHRDTIYLAPPQPGIEPVHLPDHRHALAWLTNEHKTLLAAIEHAADSGSDTHAWQLAWTMWTYLDLRGHWHDLGHTQTLALAAASRLDNRQAQAHAHRCLARAHRHAGRLDDAQAHLKQALDLFAEAGDHHGEGQIHYNISIVHGLQGNQWQALSHARLALKRFRAAGRPSMQAQTLNQIGSYHIQLGDFEQALTHCRKAVALLQRVGNRHGQAGVWLNLGYAHHHLGNHDQAADCYRRALDRYRDLGDRHGEADTLIKVGDNQVAGDPESARHSWQQALHILDELGHPDAAQARLRLDR